MLGDIKTTQHLFTLKALLSALLSVALVADVLIILESMPLSTEDWKEALVIPVFIGIPVLILLTIGLMGVLKNKGWAHTLLLIFLCIALPFSVASGYIGSMLFQMAYYAAGSFDTTTVMLACLAVIPLLVAVSIVALWSVRKIEFIDKRQK